MEDYPGHSQLNVQISKKPLLGSIGRMKDRFDRTERLKRLNRTRVYLKRCFTPADWAKWLYLSHELGSQYISEAIKAKTLRTPVSSLVATNPIGSEAVCKNIYIGDGETMLKIGAGTGPIIDNALKYHCAPQGKIIVIEINPHFTAFLEREYAEEIAKGRLEVICANAVNLEEILKARGIESVEYTVSGMPFSNDFALTGEILEQIKRMTTRRLVVYNFSPESGNAVERLHAESSVTRSKCIGNLFPPLEITEVNYEVAVLAGN